MRRFLVISVLVLFAIPASALAINDNLIIYGGFEEPKVTLGEPYDHYGNFKNIEFTPLPGWDSYSYFKGVVLFYGPIYEPNNPVPEGFQAVQIEVGGDWISQKFATIIGQRYELSFYLSAYGGYGPSEDDTLMVTVDPVSEPAQPYLNLVGNSAAYVRYTMTFTANSPETTLTFQNTAPTEAWGNYPQIDNVVVKAIPTFISVAIDIRPWGDRNRINPRSYGKIPVVILSTSDFNAPEEVDQSSLTFGYTGEEQSLAFCSICPVDVNGDGMGDLICQFYIHRTGFQCGDTEGILKGKTINGTIIEGKDFISIEPCQKPKHNKHIWWDDRWDDRRYDEERDK